MFELTNHKKCLCGQPQSKHVYGKGFCTVPGSTCTKYRPVTTIKEEDDLEDLLDEFADIFGFKK